MKKLSLLVAIGIFSFGFSANPLLEKPLNLFEYGMLALENELEGFKDDPADVSVHYSKQPEGKEILQVSLYMQAKQPDRKTAFKKALSDIRVLQVGWSAAGEFSFGTHLTFLKYFIPESGRKVDQAFVSQSEKWLRSNTRIWVQYPFGNPKEEKWVMCEAWLKDSDAKKCWDNSFTEIPLGQFFEP